MVSYDGKDETVNHIISEYTKQAPKEYKISHESQKKLSTDIFVRDENLNLLAYGICLN